MMTMLLLAAVQGVAPPAPGRPCVLEIDSIGGLYREVQIGPNVKNSFAGGGVLAHCRGTSSMVSADSFAHLGAPDRLDLVRNVRIRDTSLALDATTASYFLKDERLEAHKDVVAVNRQTGSVLRGPNVTYYRAVQGRRDTTEMFATGRPTIDYHSARDTTEPYVVVADRVHFKGDDRFWGGGRVTIDRSDLAIRADSVLLDERAGLSVLVGNPRIEGKGGDAYALTGRRIELDLDGRDVRRARALGSGTATGSDWRLNADTIHLTIDERRVQHVDAWGDSTRPRAVSTETTVRGDSLALDMPDQVLEELRAFGNAHSTSARDPSADSAVGDDWMSGDTLVARFASVPADTGSRPRSELRRLRAVGHARALLHLRKAGAQRCWSRNYSRGQQIDVTMRADSVEQVLVTGQADGVQLECLAARPDSAAPSTRPPGTP
jgi:hypothetical protein